LPCSPQDDDLSIYSGINYLDYNDKIAEVSPNFRFIRVLLLFIFILQFNEELGYCSYKIIYKGYDKDSGCEIIWDVIKLQSLLACNSFSALTRSLDDRKSLSAQIFHLSQLSHPNIIKIISY